MKDVSRVVSSAEAVEVSSAKAGRRGPHRLLTNCCLTPSSFPFHYLSNSTFFSRNRNAISFHLWDKGDLLNCFTFSSKHKAVRFLDRKLLSASLSCFVIDSSLWPKLESWGSQRGQTFGTGQALPALVAMVFCCRDKLSTSGWAPELLFVKDKWKSQRGERQTDTEREPCFFFLFSLYFDCRTADWRTLTTSKLHPPHSPLNAGIPIDHAPLFKPFAKPFSLRFCDPHSSLPTIKAVLAVLGPLWYGIVFLAVSLSLSFSLSPALGLSLPRVVSPFLQYYKRALSANRDLLTVRKKRQGGLRGRAGGGIGWWKERWKQSDSVIFITVIIMIVADVISGLIASLSDLTLVLDLVIV